MAKIALDLTPQEWKFYQAVAVVKGLSGEFKVDLVDAGDCPPQLKQVIESEGISV